MNKYLITQNIELQNKQRGCDRVSDCRIDETPTYRPIRNS